MKVLKLIYITLLIMLLYTPVIILIVNSFNSSIYSNKWEGFSLRWYQLLYTNHQLIDAAKTSSILALLSSSIAIFLGVITSFLMYTHVFPGKNFLFPVIQIMISFPDILLGISFLVIFTTFNIKLGFMTLLLSHVGITYPFATWIIYIRLMKIDKSMLEAAKDLGSPDHYIFSKIYVPMIIQNIIIGYLICFSISFDDVMVSHFVTGPAYELLPLKILSLIRLNITPEINALCTGMTMVSILCTGLTYCLVRSNKSVS